MITLLVGFFVVMLTIAVVFCGIVLFNARCQTQLLDEITSDPEARETKP